MRAQRFAQARLVCAAFTEERVELGADRRYVHRHRHRLDRADRGRRHRKVAEADGDQRHRLQGASADFAAQRDRAMHARAGVRDDLERAQECGGKRIEAEGDALVVAIGGKHVLHQIVGADREEVGAPRDFVDLPQQRRHFDHRAERDRSRRLAADALHEADLAVEDLTAQSEFLRSSTPSAA